MQSNEGTPPSIRKSIMDSKNGKIQVRKARSSSWLLKQMDYIYDTAFVWLTGPQDLSLYFVCDIFYKILFDKMKYKSLTDLAWYDITVAAQKHRHGSFDVETFWEFLHEHFTSSDLLLYACVRELLKELTVSRGASADRLVPATLTSQHASDIVSILFTGPLSLSAKSRQTIDTAIARHCARGGALSTAEFLRMLLKKRLETAYCRRITLEDPYGVEGSEEERLHAEPSKSMISSPSMRILETMREKLQAQRQAKMRRFHEAPVVLGSMTIPDGLETAEGDQPQGALSPRQGRREAFLLEDQSEHEPEPQTSPPSSTNRTPPPLSEKSQKGSGKKSSHARTANTPPHDSMSPSDKPRFNPSGPAFQRTPPRVRPTVNGITTAAATTRPRSPSPVFDADVRDFPTNGTPPAPPTFLDKFGNFLTSNGIVVSPQQQQQEAADSGPRAPKPVAHDQSPTPLTTPSAFTTSPSNDLQQVGGKLLLGNVMERAFLPPSTDSELDTYPLYLGSPQAVAKLGALKSLLLAGIKPPGVMGASPQVRPRSRPTTPPPMTISTFNPPPPPPSSSQAHPQQAFAIPTSTPLDTRSQPPQPQPNPQGPARSFTTFGGPPPLLGQSVPTAGPPHKKQAMPDLRLLLSKSVSPPRAAPNRQDALSSKALTPPTRQQQRADSPPQPPEDPQPAKKKAPAPAAVLLKGPTKVSSDLSEPPPSDTAFPSTEQSPALVLNDDLKSEAAELPPGDDEPVNLHLSEPTLRPAKTLPNLSALLSELPSLRRMLDDKQAVNQPASGHRHDESPRTAPHSNSSPSLGLATNNHQSHPPPSHWKFKATLEEFISARTAASPPKARDKRPPASTTTSPASPLVGKGSPRMSPINQTSRSRALTSPTKSPTVRLIDHTKQPPAHATASRSPMRGVRAHQGDGGGDGSGDVQGDTLPSHRYAYKATLEEYLSGQNRGRPNAKTKSGAAQGKQGKTSVGSRVSKPEPQSPPINKSSILQWARGEGEPYSRAPTSPRPVNDGSTDDHNSSVPFFERGGRLRKGSAGGDSGKALVAASTLFLFPTNDNASAPAFQTLSVADVACQTSPDLFESSSSSSGGKPRASKLSRRIPQSRSRSSPTQQLGLRSSPPLAEGQTWSSDPHDGDADASTVGTSATPPSPHNSGAESGYGTAVYNSRLSVSDDDEHAWSERDFFASARSPRFAYTSESSSDLTPLQPRYPPARKTAQIPIQQTPQTEGDGGARAQYLEPQDQSLRGLIQFAHEDLEGREFVEPAEAEADTVEIEMVSDAAGQSPPTYRGEVELIEEECGSSADVCEDHRGIILQKQKRATQQRFLEFSKKLDSLATPRNEHVTTVEADNSAPNPPPISDFLTKVDQVQPAVPPSSPQSSLPINDRGSEPAADAGRRKLAALASRLPPALLQPQHEATSAKTDQGLCELPSVIEPPPSTEPHNAAIHAEAPATMSQNHPAPVAIATDDPEPWSNSLQRLKKVMGSLAAPANEHQPSPPSDVFENRDPGSPQSASESDPSLPTSTPLLPEFVAKHVPSSSSEVTIKSPPLGALPPPTSKVQDFLVRSSQHARKMRENHHEILSKLRVLESAKQTLKERIRSKSIFVSQKPVGL